MYTSNENIIADLKGDKKRQVLEYLYKEYAKKVKSLIKSHGGSKDDGEDIFQESIMVFYKKVISNELTAENCNIGGFLVGVSKKKWYTKIKKETTREKYHDLANNDINHTNSGMQDILNKERQQIILGVLELLGENCKELIRMVIYENRRMKEITEIMGFASIDVAKTSHYRCKKKLTSLLKNNTNFKSLLIEHDN